MKTVRRFSVDYGFGGELWFHELDDGRAVCHHVADGATVYPDYTSGQPSTLEKGGRSLTIQLCYVCVAQHRDPLNAPPFIPPESAALTPPAGAPTALGGTKTALLPEGTGTGRVADRGDAYSELADRQSGPGRDK